MAICLIINKNDGIDHHYEITINYTNTSVQYQTPTHYADAADRHAKGHACKTKGKG
jgi:hypothetical protein